MGADAIREVKTVAGLSRCFRPHVHDELSVAQVWGGAARAWIAGAGGDGRATIEGDCLVLIAPRVAHACNPLPGSGWRYTMAYLDPAAAPGLVTAPCRVLPSTPRLRRLFGDLAGAGDPADRAALAEPLLAALDAAVPAAGAVPAPARPSALRRVMEQLRGHLDRPLSLEELGAVAGLSRYHLVRAFSQAYGLTPHAYHLSLRINAAKAGLRQGRDPAAVALETGFCDQSHLTRVFTRCVGLTPAAYRRGAAIPV
jgi:AraC-like DNA-binding protein